GSAAQGSARRLALDSSRARGAGLRARFSLRERVPADEPGDGFGEGVERLAVVQVGRAGTAAVTGRFDPAVTALEGQRPVRAVANLLGRLEACVRLVVASPAPDVDPVHRLPEAVPLRLRRRDGDLAPLLVAGEKALVDEPISVPPHAVRGAAEVAEVDLERSRSTVVHQRRAFVC